MSKKIIKRSLVLGALMAFVITGSAMAKEITGDYVGVYDSTKGYTVLTVDDINDKQVVLNGANIEKYHVYACNSETDSKVANGYTLTIKNGTVINNNETYLSAARAVVKGTIDEVNGNTLSIEGGNINAEGIHVARVIGVPGNTINILDVSGNRLEITGGNVANHENNTSEGIGIVVLSNVDSAKINGNEIYIGGNAKVEDRIVVAGVNRWTSNVAVMNNSVTLADNAEVNNGIHVYRNTSNQAVSDGQISSATNNTLNIDKSWTGNELTEISGFDTINIGWEKEERLLIESLTPNTISNDKVTFKLNDLSTTVRLQDNTTNQNVAWNIEATGRVNDQMQEGEGFDKNLEKLLDAVYISNTDRVDDDTTGDNGSTSGSDIDFKIDAGTLSDSVSGTYGQNGITNLQKEENPYNASVNDMTSLGLISWRAETNDMNKRMGELRNANGEHGVWVRMVRGEAEYQSVKNQYNQYQLGYDEKLSVDKRWTVGAALSYTDAENNFQNGSGESENKALAIYGSKLNDDGSFVDLIAKYGRLENDFKVNGGIGDADYSTNAYSLSAEFGKRIEQGKGLWIEPQVELTYGKVSNVTYTAERGATVAQDGMESLIGRVGFSLGKDIRQGNVYARASYLYDFDGEANATMKYGTQVVPVKEDLGGGWWEVGVGANINLSKSTYIYADVEKTFGGEVDTNWQWNLGVRYSF